MSPRPFFSTVSWQWLLNLAVLKSDAWTSGILLKPFKGSWNQIYFHKDIKNSTFPPTSPSLPPFLYSPSPSFSSSSFFHCVHSCTGDAKSVVSKIAGTLTQSKKGPPNCTKYYSPHTHRKKTKHQLELDLEEAVKIIKVIKSWPLHTQCFKILYYDMGGTHKGTYHIWHVTH